MAKDRYTIELENFGKRFKALRKAAKLTQLDIEVRSGIDRADISRIENGNKNLEFFTIVKLAEAIEVELVSLFEKS